MKYLLIRNCRIPNYNPQELFSVLIGGNKILQIDKNIMHPAIDTREYDAQGNVLIPSLVDVASDFGEASTEDDLTKTAIADVEAGITSWITPMTPSSIDKNTTILEHKSDRFLNYGYHLSLNNITRKIDAVRSKLVVLPRGISSIYFRVTTPATREAIENVGFILNCAADLETTVVIELVREGSANEHVSTLLKLAGEIEVDPRNRVYFLNVRYEEELDILRRMQNVCIVGAELRYSPLHSDVETLKEFTAERYCDILRSHSWCSASIVRERMSYFGITNQNNDFLHKNQLSIIYGLPVPKPFTAEELIEFTTMRASKMLGLWPNYGRVEVGADADLIVWNDRWEETAKLQEDTGQTIGLPLRGKIDCVVMNGNVVYDADGVIANNIDGRYIYRRLLF